MLLDKACTKKQFLQYACISRSTLLRWLKQHKQTLDKFGQKKYSKYLLPQTVQFLAKYYEVTDDVI